MKTLKEIREQEGCGKRCQGCEFLSFCDDCGEKICSAYDKDYRNIDNTTETLCGICYQLRLYKYKKPF